MQDSVESEIYEERAELAMVMGKRQVDEASDTPADLTLEHLMNSACSFMVFDCKSIKSYLM